MTLSERLNKIITEQNISKTEFANRLGVTANYIYIMTSDKPNKRTLSPALAKLIALQFGYDEEWILNGDK